MEIRNMFLLLSLLCFMSACNSQKATVESNVLKAAKEDKPERPKYAMVIHGGAGTILKENLTEEQEYYYKRALYAALQSGEVILENGGTALNAVEITIKYLEDVPLFNAGKGAVFTNAGINELDASIMDGNTMQAGAVGGVTNIKNPISAAIEVMKNSNHVLLVGDGAEEFAKKQGLELVEPEYFKTEDRWNALQKAKAKEKDTGSISEDNPDWKFGTVGCVAMDQFGNIVAGTSTGGMTNKRYNRIGDSPIIGAGTYANNNTCGVSCTGHGEFFIRYAVAHDVSAIMEYTDATLAEATHKVIMEKLVKAKGSGGLVALDKDGNISMTFNTPGMYRGWVKPGERFVAIYKDEQ